MSTKNCILETILTFHCTLQNFSFVLQFFGYDAAGSITTIAINLACVCVCACVDLNNGFLGPG